ncbi:DNA topoisomerase 1 [Cyclospora cayetanensis]|uniref:DNA topoisomerase 1 n=1 Tax=Cyclospora cayetanensis TaxID=88456 RepID=A0A6P6RUJ6_9EIME|nr:DNA topoisomerase 1 [Cyclospora cayetanensis]
MTQKKRELGSDSSDEDTLPLGAKRFKQCKVEPEAAVAVSAAGAAEGGEPAKVENGDSKFLVKEAVSCSSSTTTTTGSCSTNGRADDSAGAAQGSTARGVAVKGSLAAALSNVKTDVKDGEMPKAAAAGTATGISRPSASPSPVGARRRNKYTKTEENFEPISRWWEKDLSQLENNVVQWQYLEHNGMIFAPPYEPHGIGIKYKGQEVSLPPEAEEVANFWCGVLESDYATKMRFVKNFWRAFLSKLPADHLIKQDPKHATVRLVDTEADGGAAAAAGENSAAAAAAARAPAAAAAEACGFEACDFSKIKQHLDTLKEAKKNLSKEEKEALKAQKDAEAAPFAFALVDWLREKVGNCKAEPPGLFRGRGEHPKQGMLKRRIFPEDVILNLGEDAPVPRAPDMPGHCWKDIAHDCRVTWLAFYRDSINDQVKYMYLAAQSGFKGQQDFLKYEKARRLKHYVVKIREDYYKKMRSADPLDRQLGTATYLIDFLALRVGGEKDTDEEADTVGCCSLRVEHTTLNSETEEVTFDFLGKDSIRYFNTVKIDSQAFKNLVGFCRGKKPEEDVFDRINSTSLNNHLKQLMPGLSAKMFRTYNASITLQQELQKLQPTLRKFKEEVETEHQKKMSKVKGKKTVKAEQEAAVAVAAAVATTTSDDDEDVPLGCISAKKEKKVTPVLDVNLSDVNQLVQAVAILCNHQRSVPKQHAASMARLEHQLQAIEEDLRELKAFQQHLKKNKGAAKGFKFHSDFVSLKGEPRKSVVRDGMREEAVTKKIAQVEKKKQSHLVRMRMKDDNKTVALGTSKINYMDPRITVAFCKQYELPIEKVFNKSLRLKFPWAMFAPSNFIF